MRKSRPLPALVFSIARTLIKRVIPVIGLIAGGEMKKTDKKTRDEGAPILEHVMISRRSCGDPMCPAQKTKRHSCDAEFQNKIRIAEIPCWSC